MSGTGRCNVGLVGTKKQWKWERKKVRRLAHDASPRQEKKKAVVLEDASMRQLADVSDDKRYHEGSIGDTMRKSCREPTNSFPKQPVRTEVMLASESPDFRCMRSAAVADMDRSVVLVEFVVNWHPGCAAASGLRLPAR
jgi:hypothetical protein